jgi:hypothetical protein
MALRSYQYQINEYPFNRSSVDVGIRSDYDDMSDEGITDNDVIMKT